MKVTVCPNCRITPEITNTMLKCPKCGRTATGAALNETVTKWNAGEVTVKNEAKAVIKDEEAPKEDIREEIEDEIKEEPKRPAPKKAAKPVEKAPVKRTTKRGMK